MIAPNGEVRPCPLVSDVYGNVMDNDGLVNAWRAMKSWRDDSLLPQQCLDCGHKVTCAGGCKADAKHSGGSYGFPDPYCNFNHTAVIPKVSLEKKKLQSSYQVNPKLRFRTESFGGVVFVRGLKWCATDQSLYDALQQSSARFSVGDFARKMDVSDAEAERTMSFLIGKGVLVEPKN
jgi:radical SAM protein with 4Fe4S-binding SPASM domain